MRFEHDGRSLWFGTADAPAPEPVQTGEEAVITVGVWPVDPGNRVELLYRVNQGAIKNLSARWLRNEPTGKAQYFRVGLPAFHAGDVVEYIPICGCAGRQVPGPDEARKFVASFKVGEARTASSVAVGVIDRPAKQSVSKNVAAPGTVLPEPRPNGSPVTIPLRPVGPSAPLPVASDLRRARTLEYAGLAGLDQHSANRLLQKNLTFDRLDGKALTGLVRDGILTENQTTDLNLTLELAKLTGDNLEFVRSLKRKGLKSVSDLLSWKRDDWQRLIATENIPLLAGETPVSYPENILQNLELTYPSQLLINRLLSDWHSKITALESSGVVAKSNRQETRTLNRVGNERAAVASLKSTGDSNGVRDLTAFANAFRHLGTLTIVNDVTTSLSQKKDALAGRLQLLDVFHQSNPGVDLRSIDFFSSDNGGLNWVSIPANERPLVRRQLMAYQRVLNLADSTADRETLLSKGYDSAMSIANQTEAEFIRTSGLAADNAKRAYAQAQTTALETCLDCGAIQDAVWGGFANLAVNNLPPTLVNELGEIDGYDELFGPQDFCDCDACKSILGPAAYFVDLMSFIERHVSVPVFVNGNLTNHSLYLRNRRGDLWSLALSCENTNGQIPYLVVVNEVLETYLRRLISGDVFARLNERAGQISFALPFALPLEELRLYLGHFGLSLHDIYLLLKQDDNKVWRERLRISAQELHLITSPDTGGVRQRFGNPSSLNDFYVDDYQNISLGIDARGFIRYAGLTRAELSELLTMRFTNLDDIVVNKQTIANELQNFPEILGGLTDLRLDFIHRFIRLWRKSGWTITQFDLILMTIRDAGLIAQDLSGMNFDLVQYLGHLIDIQEKLSLTVEELCTLIDESPNVELPPPNNPAHPQRTTFARLPVSREFPRPVKPEDRLLYERLFDTRKLFEDPITHRMQTTTTFYHPSLDLRNLADRAIDPKTPVLLMGLGVTETELLLLFDLLHDYILFDSEGKTVLDRERISLLFRHARLAKALKLSVEDLIHALRLNFGVANQVIKNLDQIDQLLQFRDWLKLSSFTVSELRFILKGEDSPGVKFQINLQSVIAVVNETQNLQPWSKQSPDREVAIVREVQNSAATLRSEALKGSLAQFFGLTSDRVLEVLNAINIDIQSSEIGNALNATFTNDVIDDPTVLNALTELLTEIEAILQSEGCRASLARVFDLTAKELDDTLQWVNGAIDSAAVSLALNTTFTQGVPDNEASLLGLLNLMQEIERVVELFRKLKLKEENLSYLARRPAALGLGDLKNLTLNQVRTLTSYQTLIARQDPVQPVVHALLDSYLDSQTFADESALADLWRVEQSLIESVNNSLTFPLTPIEALDYLGQVVRVCQTLGIDGYSLQKLVDDSTYEALVVARGVAVGAFTSKYDDEKVRQEKLEPYLDQINVLKRDALCDYIIARESDLKFKDANDLYAFFLLDVEMSGCFRTSRVVAAISSLQLYAHRLLANLEQSVLGDLVVLARAYQTYAFKHEWEWRSSYRVWEANRKVFLYPENYIEPDLRDNKTQIFRELEDELLQENISRQSAEDAYRKYVSSLTELSKLRIVASCFHTDESRYYIFGRTHTQPYQYYYRTYERIEDQYIWGNWVKMEVAIEAAELSPLVHLRRLYVFWTQIERRELSQIEDAQTKPGGYAFKVFAKYSYLTEHGKWCAPQKAYLGYAHFTDDEVRTRIVGRTATIADADRLPLVERFQEEVFRRPYPVLTDDLAWPIKLYYIWSHEKPVAATVPVDITEQYTTTPLTDVLSYLDQVNYNRVDRACETETAEGNVSLPAYQISVRNDAFPVTRSVTWELNGHPIRNRGRLTLLGPTECTVELTFPDPSPVARGCTSRRYQPTKTTITPAVQLTGTSTPPAYAPRVSSHDLSLATTQIKDAGNIRPSFVSITDHSFLQPEYDLAYASEDQGNYVQDGTDSFTMAGRSIRERQWNSYELMLSNQGPGISLSTIEMDELNQRIFGQSLEEFLSPITQTLLYSGGALDFAGPYGNYFWELFFHIPFLIAHHLNANQKFSAAQWWYERIFDPTSSDPPVDPAVNDRIWRYSLFRDLDITTLRNILVNGAAIQLYKADPFNPHAIARLRWSAYQKTIVMRFIDNLIDWGDNLFAQDTMESINEATMLYVLASDILGKRPAKLGKCGSESTASFTFAEVVTCPDQNTCDNNLSEFLVYLENWHFSTTIIFGGSSSSQAPSPRFTSTRAVRGRTTSNSLSLAEGLAVDSGLALSRDSERGFLHFNDVQQELTRNRAIVGQWNSLKPSARFPNVDLTLQRSLAFCVPPNYDLLAYWDRVEDRLFKIRHCMNISGVRRQLALFQPPIDPLVLVRAKVGGLSLEDVLQLLAAPAPRYRFSYLIEKARQFCQTVQGFGSLLLSALEKKDTEELTLLRSLHERHILNLTREIKKQQLRDAQYQYQAMVETQANVKNRIDYYQGLVDEGLTGWEITQQVAKHTATGLIIGKGVLDLIAGIIYTLPQIGSPFAMKYGGKEQGDSTAGFADWLGDLASVAEAISASAALEASFQRREQEWKQQLLLAQQEMKQIEQQRLAADVRQLIAARDLEVHEKNIEQSAELDEFYKNKFTSLGLYNYLATSLTRLYRESYSLAYDMARMAERAYQSERGDETAFFIAADNWQFDRAGLLAGERLLLQLQRLEKAFIEQPTRDYEVNQSFSLALISPSTLVDLRDKGRCQFTIPEIWFDLFYPGQYRRMIKSVRLSIPCVAGPYSNVSAKLTLQNYKVRKSATSGPLDLIGANPSVSIATSTAQNDGGLFELNFRDERYLPFEGAGAVDSSWDLQLPANVRLFDYNTISDVVIHVSYTAKDGGAFKDAVEHEIATALTNVASTTGLYRLLSMKHEFPNAFYRFFSSDTEQATTIEMSERHFPYFLTNIPVDPDSNDPETQNLNLSNVKIYLRAKAGQTIETSGLTVRLNGSATINNWALIGRNLQQGDVSLTGSPIRSWTIAAEPPLSRDALEDVLLLLSYNLE